LASGVIDGDDGRNINDNSKEWLEIVFWVKEKMIAALREKRIVALISGLRLDVFQYHYEITVKDTSSGVASYHHCCKDIIRFQRS
ncbi:unnamed protein product, partial [Dovyalis caffra]